MLLLSTGFIMWVMRENSFAAPVVKLQTERGHRVISTGPYAWVRHPMYSGHPFCFFVGAPLLLGSWWGVAMSPLFVVLFAVSRFGSRNARCSPAWPAMGITRRRLRYRPGCPGFGKAYTAESHSRSGRGAMPESKTYTGGCHCGMVRLQCTADLAVVTACKLLDLHQVGPAFHLRTRGEVKQYSPRAPHI